MEEVAPAARTEENWWKVTEAVFGGRGTGLWLGADGGYWGRGLRHKGSWNNRNLTKKGRSKSLNLILSEPSPGNYDDIVDRRRVRQYSQESGHQLLADDHGAGLRLADPVPHPLLAQVGVDSHHRQAVGQERVNKLNIQAIPLVQVQRIIHSYRRLVQVHWCKYL